MADKSTKVGFARKQLEKHGWSEGKGLGKEESGISKAIKVNIKTDSAGVGYDAGDQFSFHWWDHVFNKTAKSIVVQESEEGVEVVKSSKDTCTVSNKRPSKNANKPLLYGRFVKASCQTQESKAQESNEDSELEKDFSHLCPEEKLFQACGGRTAHKAARHGFRLNGKLQRVEKQEKLEIAIDSCKAGAAECSDSDLNNCVVEEKQQYKEKENKRRKDKDRKKKKRKHMDMNEENDNKLEDKCHCEDDVDEKQGKTKKRKSRDMKASNDHKFKDKLNSCEGDVEEKRVKKNKRKIRDKKGKNDHKLEEECNSLENEVEETRAIKKKRKKQR